MRPVLNSGVDAGPVVGLADAPPPRVNSSIASRAAKGMFNAALDGLRIQFGNPSRNFYSYRWTKSVAFRGDKCLRDKARTYPDAVELSLYVDDDLDGGFTTQCPPESLRDILLFKDLKKIVLQGSYWTDDHLSIIAQHPALRSIAVNTAAQDSRAPGMIFQDLTTEYPASCTPFALPSLDTQYEQPPITITDRGIEAVSRNANLTSLEFTNCKQLTDRCLEYIGEMHALHTLSLISAEAITNDGLRFLGNLPDLRVLNLNGLTGRSGDPRHRNIGGAWSQFDSRGIQAIAMHRNLNQLSLANCVGVTDHDLQTIGRQFKFLNSLNLQGCRQITTAGVRNMQNLPHLTALNLTYTQINDDALRFLPVLPRLRMLSIANCHRLTQNIVGTLKTMPALRYLNVENCAGVAQHMVARELQKTMKCLQFPYYKIDQ